MKKSIFSTLFISSILFFSSCMGDGSSTAYITGMFSVGKEGNNYVLYRDYGGVVYPTYETAKNLKEGERYWLNCQYSDNNLKNIDGKGTYIANAEILEGQTMIKQDLLTVEEAVNGNLHSADSVFTNLSVAYLGAYRGFFTISFTGQYSIIKYCEKCKAVYPDSETTCSNENCNKKTLSLKAVQPSMNAIYETKDNQLNLKLIYNQHTDKKTQKLAQSTTFYHTYPLSAIKDLIPGHDSIKVSVNIEGMTIKDAELPMGREDLTPGNYLYFTFK